MSYIRNRNQYFVIGLMLAVLSGIMLFGFTQVASAEERGSGRQRSWIRVMAITMPTRHAVSTLKGCQAVTGR